MRAVIGFLVGLYVLIFLLGYIPAKIEGEKMRPLCERLMSSEKIWLFIVFAHGEANACLDLGVMPKKEN